MTTFQLRMTAFLCLSVLGLVSCARETGQQTPDPGFRPDSEHALTFLEALDTATIVVFPSNIRRVEGTTVSATSQAQIVSLLNKKNMKAVAAGSDSLDPGELAGRSQWEMFQNDMSAIAHALASRRSNAQYSLIMEFLFPPGSQAVFGIHCYILDSDGRNAFSFLLNSHHRLFVDANLSPRDASDAARARLLENATQVGVTALLQQIAAARDPARANREGYTIATTKLRVFDQKPDRIFVMASVEESLRPVFLHSFEHSLIAAFESNGVAAIFRLEPDQADRPVDDATQLQAFGPDAIMRIDVDPLYRKHRLGHQAVVGTDFAVSLIDMATGEQAWHAIGQVNYIGGFYFDRREYRAHEGMRKEFAWHTTAAIVRAFAVDVMNQTSAPIYTITEDRQRHGQRVD